MKTLKRLILLSILKFECISIKFFIMNIKFISCLVHRGKSTTTAAAYVIRYNFGVQNKMTAAKFLICMPETLNK